MAQSTPGDPGPGPYSGAGSRAPSRGGPRRSRFRSGAVRSRGRAPPGTHGPTSVPTAPPLKHRNTPCRSSSNDHRRRPRPVSVAHPQADEVLFQGICLHTASLGRYFFWFLISMLGGTLAWALGHIELMAKLPLWVLGFAGFPGVLYTFLKHVTTKYKVSRKRIEYERGILSKTVDSLELWRVLDVKYQQNLIDRIFGNAKITLIGTDQTDPELVLYGLPNHRKLFEELRESVQAARHTSRPMELVGQDGLEGGIEAM